MASLDLGRAGEAWFIDEALIQQAEASPPEGFTRSFQGGPSVECVRHAKAMLRRAVQSGLPLVEMQHGILLNRADVAQAAGLDPSGKSPSLSIV